MIEQFEKCVSDYDSDSEFNIAVPINRRLRTINDSSEDTSQLNAQFVQLKRSYLICSMCKKGVCVGKHVCK